MRILLTILFLFSSIAYGQTNYYISTSGNDGTGTGTVGNPWKTLAKATTVATTFGDTIRVAAGSYTETVQSTLSRGVSIYGAGRSTTTFINHVTGGQYAQMVDAKSATQGLDGNCTIYGIKVDGESIGNIGFFFTCRSNIKIVDCEFLNLNEGAVFIAASTTGSEIEPTTYSKGNVVTGNIFTNNGAGNNPGRGQIRIGGIDSSLIYNNTFTNSRASGNNGYGIKYYNEGWYKALKIYNNTFWKTPCAYSPSLGSPPDWAFCMEFARANGGMEVYNNTLTGGGIDINICYPAVAPHTYSYYVHDNIITNTVANIVRDAGILLEFSSDDVIIEDNFIRNMGYGVVFTPRHLDLNAWSGNIRNITIQRNVFACTIGDGGGNYIGCYVEGGWKQNWDSIFIYNNTMLWMPGYEFIYGIGMPFSATGGTINNFQIKNNHIQGSATNAIIQYGGGAVPLTNSSITYNNFYQSGAVSITTPTPTNYTYANNISSNPLFGTNYIIDNTSPNYNTGTDVGLPYNNGVPEIGYFEVGSTPLDLPPSINPGGAQNLNFPVDVHLQALVTDDGSISSVLWQHTSGSGGTIAEPTNDTTWVYDLPEGVHTFQITATDNTAHTSTANVIVTINTALSHPIVSAGANQSITVNSTTVNGSATPFPGSTDKNLVKYSDKMTDPLWVTSDIPFKGDNAALDVAGNMTLDSFLFTYNFNNSWLRQDVAVQPSTTYYLSFDCKKGTMANLIWTAYNSTAFSTIKTENYTSQTNTSTASRVTGFFTTPGGCNSVYLIMHENTTFGNDGTVYLGRVQITPTEANAYIRTTSAQITSPVAAGVIDTYLWTVVSGTATINSPTSQNTTISAISSDTVVVRLRVAQTNDEQNQDEMNIYYSPAAAPVRGFRINKRIIYNPN